jgi:serine/threonine-protein kinase
VDVDTIPPTPISLLPPSITIVPPTPLPVDPPFQVPLAKPRPKEYRSPTGSLRGRIVRNRFRINFPLGRGGMSTVYLARDVYDGSLFAVKVLRADYILDEAFRARFLNELKAVRRIHHPAVVRMYDVGELNDGRLFLVMEYVHGCTLRKLVKKGQLEPDLAIPILCTIADGLRAAHQKGVVHRDLKPGNVLIPKRPSPDAVARVLDFGIARIMGSPNITSTAEVIGTPLYIAPEQAIGDPVDHRTDIYSLGVMMYEIFGGRLPFFGKDPGALLRQHIRVKPRRMSVINRNLAIPREIENMVMRCLEKSPARRPANMSEIIDVLARHERAYRSALN